MDDKDTIYRQDAIDAVNDVLAEYIPVLPHWLERIPLECALKIKGLPSAQPERLTDDDFETIRIHLNAYKEKLCNQQRWEEAEEYQRIIDRFMAFASAQPKHGKWVERNPLNSDKCRLIECDQCGNSYIVGFNVPYEHWIDNRNYCEKCGADMRTKETDCDYERAVEQLEHDMLYEPTFNKDDGSM